MNIPSTYFHRVFWEFQKYPSTGTRTDSCISSLNSLLFSSFGKNPNSFDSRISITTDSPFVTGSPSQPRLPPHHERFATATDSPLRPTGNDPPLQPILHYDQTQTIRHCNLFSTTTNRKRFATANDSPLRLRHSDRDCLLADFSRILLEMEMIVMALFIASLILGTLFIFPRSAQKSTKKSIMKDVSTKVEKIYTKEEISHHNSKNDCWIIVKGKVYDVTPYVEEHPGGDAILNNAGRDSTEGFYGPQHATRVFDMVGEFYIGELAS